ncbi:MAG: hypothetical protein NZM43_09820 [Saprospiraceae bacterium]|nr:hypothetical protein [Saprospiraceae bacterium]MDW8484613.1 hypothetical protein [Saprospiraceae bacterium]
MYIKASHIANLTDARYFAAREVNYLGFCLEENSPTSIEPAAMKAICAWVEGPSIVGEFGQADADVIRAAVEFFDLDAVQTSRLEVLPALKELEVIFQISKVDQPEDVAPILKSARPFAAFFLVELSESAARMALKDERVVQSWSALCNQAPLLFDIPLPALQTATLITAIQPAGFSLRGSAEERPGFKSFDEIDALFEALGYT